MYTNRSLGDSHCPISLRASSASFQAPGEAEAQCAALAKAGKVYATATEDMDALTFGTPKLLVC